MINDYPIIVKLSVSYIMLFDYISCQTHLEWVHSVNECKWVNYPVLDCLLPMAKRKWRDIIHDKHLMNTSKMINDFTIISSFLTYIQKMAIIFWLEDQRLKVKWRPLFFFPQDNLRFMTSYTNSRFNLNVDWCRKINVKNINTPGYIFKSSA